MLWYEKSSRTGEWFTLTSVYGIHNFESALLADAVENFLRNFREEPNGSNADGVCRRTFIQCAGESWIFEGPSERDIRMGLRVGR